jgi:hypothetical protein
MEAQYRNIPKLIYQRMDFQMDGRTKSKGRAKEKNTEEGVII